MPRRPNPDFLSALDTVDKLGPAGVVATAKAFQFVIEVDGRILPATGLRWVPGSGRYARTLRIGRAIYTTREGMKGTALEAIFKAASTVTIVIYGPTHDPSRNHPEGELVNVLRRWFITYRDVIPLGVEELKSDESGVAVEEVELTGARIVPTP